MYLPLQSRYATGDIVADELRFSLANVLFLAGSYRRALAEFEAAGSRFADRYGPDDKSALECRCYAATCQAALGENTEALAVFRAFLVDWSMAVNDSDERAFDIRRQIGMLLASVGHHNEALTSLGELRRDLVATYGEDSPEVAQTSPRC